MKKDPRNQTTRTGLATVEEAAALLRRAPLRAWIVYFTGTGAFLLAALYYLADLSAGPNSVADAVGGAGLLALLFGATKVSQSYFCCQLHGLLQNQPDAPWTVGRIGKAFLQQVATQPWGFPALFIAGLILVPYASVTAYFESHTLYADGRRSSKEAHRLALESARAWPGQNNIGLTIIGVFGLVLLINLIATIQFLPGLIRSVLGYELSIARAGYNFFNTTFLGAALCLLFLLVDPVLKAFHVVRSYHVESRASAADLRAQLRRFAPAALAAILMIGAPIFATAQSQPANGNDASLVTPKEVDTAIEEVLAREEFRWKMPRVDTADGGSDHSNPLLGFFEQLGKWFGDVWNAVWRWVSEIMRFLGDLMPKPDFGGGPSIPDVDLGWLSWVRVGLYVLLGVAVLALLILLIRQIKRSRKPRSVAAAPETPIAIPDLTEESTQADALPEDGWLQLAREMIEKGEWRLAVRAYYLSVLAHLAAHEAIRISKAKTNAQYLRECTRRLRGQKAIHQAFAERIHDFEVVWYGTHPADAAYTTAYEQATSQLREAHVES